MSLSLSAWGLLCQMHFITWSDASLTQAGHSHHKRFPVAKETFLVLKWLAIVPLDIIKAWN